MLLGRQEMDAAVWVGLTKPEMRSNVLSAECVLTGSRWFEQQRDGTNLAIAEATQARSVRAGCALAAPGPSKKQNGSNNRPTSNVI